MVIGVKWFDGFDVVMGVRWLLLLMDGVCELWNGLECWGWSV